MFLSRSFASDGDAPAAGSSVQTNPATPDHSTSVKSAEPVKSVPKGPAYPEFVKLKVNGEEIELPFQEALRRASLAEASTRRFQQAAELEKSAKAKEQAFLQNPYKYLRSSGMGHDEAKAFLEKHAVDVLSQDNLTPEQRKLREYEERDAERKETEQREHQRRQEAEEYQKAQQEMSQIDKDLSDAFAQTKFPKAFEPKLAKLKADAAALMYGAVQMGVNLTPQEAAKEIELREYQVASSLVRSLDISDLRELIGRDVLKKLRADDVAAVKAAETPFVKPQATKQAPVARDEVKPDKGDQSLSRTEWLNKLRGHNYARR